MFQSEGAATQNALLPFLILKHKLSDKALSQEAEKNFIRKIVEQGGCPYIILLQTMEHFGECDADATGGSSKENENPEIHC